MTTSDWLCTACARGHPVEDGSFKEAVVEGFGTGRCDNLDCPSRKDKGSSRKGALGRQAMVAHFRRRT